MSRIPTVLALILVSSAAAAPTAQVADGKIVISGVASAKGLSVVVAEGTEADIAVRPPMAGEWLQTDGKLVFAPKYPLRPGTKYRIVGLDTGLNVQTPKPLAKPTVVKQIYPTATEIPDNILRFYIEFNQPMPRGDAYKYIEVFTDKGKKVEWPFLQQDDEPWNADQTRLTLFIDPGRVKKGVKPRIDLGPVFTQGTKYTLVISGKWPTLDGGTLGADVRKPLTAAEPFSEALDTTDWKLAPPKDENAAVSLAFDRTLDHILILRDISIVDAVGREVAGTAETVNHDRGWNFRPKAAWRSGRYNVRVATTLEDVCGNRIGVPFEIDPARPAPKEVKADHVDLPFTVGRR
jgi:hypothetical protein